jgi:hypothetical protein
VLDLSKRTMARWTHQLLRYAKGRPRLWGLHNYTDTNKHSGLTRAFLRMVPGKVWLTETGGIVAFREAGGRVRFRHSERRAATGLARMFALARRYRARTQVSRPHDAAVRVPVEHRLLGQSLRRRPGSRERQPPRRLLRGEATPELDPLNVTLAPRRRPPVAAAS